MNCFIRVSLSFSKETIDYFIDLGILEAYSAPSSRTLRVHSIKIPKTSNISLNRSSIFRVIFGISKGSLWKGNIVYTEYLVERATKSILFSPSSIGPCYKLKVLLEKRSNVGFVDSNIIIFIFGKFDKSLIP